MSENVYLYGFVPSDCTLPDGGLLGIADRPVELLGFEPQGFRAAVSRVAAGEYDPKLVESRLNDLRWIGEQGLRHEEVVAWFLDHGEIVPARLLTLYSSAEALTAESVARAAEIRAQLRRFAGRREWDLKATCSAERLAPQLGRFSEAIAAHVVELESAAPGKRFLLERRRAELVRTETGRVAARLAADLADRLCAFAVEHRMLPPPAGADANEIPVILNLALLVEIGREDALRREVEAAMAEVAELGVHASFSGPWAPYRFLAGAL